MCVLHDYKRVFLQRLQQHISYPHQYTLIHRCRYFSTMTDEESDEEDKPLKPRKLAKGKDLILRWKVVQGDIVQIMRGREKGKRGEIIECNKLTNYIRIKNCLLRTLRDPVSLKIYDAPESIHYSRVALIDPIYDKPAKIALRLATNQELLRISKLSGAIIPWPDKNVNHNPVAYSKSCNETSSFIIAYTYSIISLLVVDGPKDTPAEIALESTFNYHEDKEQRYHWRQTMERENKHMVSY